MVPAREEKLSQLEKLLQSRILQGSESLKAFLKFVVLKMVDNQQVSLKEYTIATEVFGRSDNYDSRNDSMVRVQGGRLRIKLPALYQALVKVKVNGGVPVQLSYVTRRAL